MIKGLECCNLYALSNHVNTSLRSFARARHSVRARAFCRFHSFSVDCRSLPFLGLVHHSPENETESKECSTEKAAIKFYFFFTLSLSDGSLTAPIRFLWILS